MVRNASKKMLLYLLCVSTFSAYTCILLLSDRAFTSDDLTLFNPVYNFLQSGRLTYPVHGLPGIITVHPPVHYYGVALLMKCGLNSQQAYSAPFLISLLILLVAILISTVSFEKKLAVVLSLQVLVLFPIGSIRPDCTLALLWFTSLFCFDWASDKKHPNYLLFLAGLFLAVSSCLHYYAVFALGALPIFIMVLYKSHPRSEFYKKTSWLLAGTAVILIPYFLFFVFPNLAEILYHVNTNQGEGGIVTALKRHLDLYNPFSVFIERGTFASPLLILLYYAYFFEIPLTLIALALLLYKKETRNFAFASAPMVLMILFFSRGKTEGYFMPEQMIFLYGCALLLTNFLCWSKNRHVTPVIRYALVGWMCCICWLPWVYLISRIHPPIALQQHAMHQVRFCAQKIVGNQAQVGGRMSAWYIGGASSWYDLETDIIETKQLPTKDSLQKYFSRFVALVETRHMANVTYNTDYASLNTMYLDSILELKGFIFSENGEYDSELACLFYSVHPTSPRKGFVVKTGGDVLQLQEDSLGEMFFLIGKTERKPGVLDSILARIDPIVALNYFALPNKFASKTFYRYNEVQNDIAFMLITKRQYLQNRAFLQSIIELRETIPCKMGQIEKRSSHDPSTTPVLKYEGIASQPELQ